MDPTTENPRRLVPVKQACSYGGFGVTKFYALIKEGRIKAYKLDSRTLVDLDSIDALLASLPALTGSKAKSRPKLVKDGMRNDA